jgi:hypothetical protein
MAAKGAILKQEVMEKILETFPGSFLYNDGKEVRINGVEEGQQLQIKVTFTCAKTPVEGGSDVILPGENPVIDKPAIEERVPQEPTDEEKERLATLLDKLGW